MSLFRYVVLKEHFYWNALLQKVGVQNSYSVKGVGLSRAPRGGVEGRPDGPGLRVRKEVRGTRRGTGDLRTCGGHDLRRVERTGEDSDPYPEVRGGVVTGRGLERTDRRPGLPRGLPQTPRGGDQNRVEPPVNPSFPHASRGGSSTALSVVDYKVLSRPHTTTKTGYGTTATAERTPVRDAIEDLGLSDEPFWCS